MRPTSVDSRGRYACCIMHTAMSLLLLTVKCSGLSICRATAGQGQESKGREGMSALSSANRFPDLPWSPQQAVSWLVRQCVTAGRRPLWPLKAYKAGAQGLQQAMCTGDLTSSPLRRDLQPYSRPHPSLVAQGMLSLPTSSSDSAIMLHCWLPCQTVWCAYLYASMGK